MTENWRLSNYYQRRKKWEEKRTSGEKEKFEIRKVKEHRKLNKRQREQKERNKIGEEIEKEDEIR